MLLCAHICTQMEKFFRVGKKIISKEKVNSIIDEILQRRSSGATQKEVAKIFHVERSFVSHLEGLGEIRKGPRIALIGFPIKNTNELEKVSKECGVELVFLLSQKEREEFAKKESGSDLFNRTLMLLAELKDYDAVIFLGSDWRISIVEKILEKEIYGISLGASPIKKDVYIEPEELKSLIKKISPEKKKGRVFEKGSKRKSWVFKKEPRGRSRASRRKSKN